MKRHLPLSIAVILVLGAAFSVAATQSKRIDEASPLNGKSVIIEMKGAYFGVKENVRFESVGRLDYIVVPMNDAGANQSYEHWWRLDEVYAIKVFDSKEEALAHDKKTSPFRKPNETSNERSQ